MRLDRIETQLFKLSQLVLGEGVLLSEWAARAAAIVSRELKLQSGLMKLMALAGAIEHMVDRPGGELDLDKLDPSDYADLNPADKRRLPEIAQAFADSIKKQSGRAEESEKIKLSKKSAKAFKQFVGDPKIAKKIKKAKIRELEPESEPKAKPKKKAKSPDTEED